MDSTSTTLRLESVTLGNVRRVWVERVGVGRTPLVVLLDGEYYRDRMQLLERLREATSDEVLPPATYAFVSHVDETMTDQDSVRWRESFCNETFADFVVDDVIPAVEATLSDTPSQRILAGLSLTGLAATHIALRRPSMFDAVIAQSGSFWWNDCWLAKQRELLACQPTVFELCCGLEEVDTNVDHGHGLLQAVSQLDANSQLVDALTQAGHTVRFETYAGGHALAPWAEHFVPALKRLINRSNEA